jgi:hypothetical protein
MTAPLSLIDKWNSAPVGPVTDEPHNATAYRTELGQLTENAVFLFNRLLLTLFGAFKTFLPGAVDATADTITITAHGLADDDPIRFGNVGGVLFSILGVVLPNSAGLNAATFYAIVVDVDTIQIALLPGGGATDITATGTFTHYLFKVPLALHAIQAPSFDLPNGQTIPAGALVATLAFYFLSTKGGTMTQALKHSGNGAKTVTRRGALLDTATQGFTGTQKDGWRCPDVSQDSVATIADGVEDGDTTMVYRRAGSNAYKMDIEDSGTNLIVRFPASGKSWARLVWTNDDGTSIKWHACDFGGDAIPGT